jgi:hypothetical protein
VGSAGAAGSEQQQGPFSDLLRTLAASPVAKFLSREAKRLPSVRLASGTSDILRNLTSSGVAQVANRNAEVSRIRGALSGQPFLLLPARCCCCVDEHTATPETRTPESAAH